MGGESGPVAILQDAAFGRSSGWGRGRQGPAVAM